MVKSKSNTRNTSAKPAKSLLRTKGPKVPAAAEGSLIVSSRKRKKGAVANGVPENAPAPVVVRPSGTKKALITMLLCRADGAGVSELMTQTGWLAHSLRAALTGLRKEGFDITRSRNADGETTYCISSRVSA